jgi:hypothetical protein
MINCIYRPRGEEISTTLDRLASYLYYKLFFCYQILTLFEDTFTLLFLGNVPRELNCHSEMSVDETTNNAVCVLICVENHRYCLPISPSS